jgi:hypothetical protein
MSEGVTASTTDQERDRSEVASGPKRKRTPSEKAKQGMKFGYRRTEL